MWEADMGLLGQKPTKLHMRETLLLMLQETDGAEILTHNLTFERHQGKENLISFPP
jgi:hypothetical protein